MPADRRQAVLDHLIAGIKAKGDHLTVGEIALPSVFRVLSAADRDDIIYQVATRTDSPSYGDQVTHGATSLTENWDGPTSGNSQNHFMLGAIDEWFGSGLAGIRQGEGSVGFDRLLIRPAVVGDLTRASASYDTPRGTVTSSWRREGTTFRLDRARGRFGPGRGPAARRERAARGDPRRQVGGRPGRPGRLRDGDGPLDLPGARETTMSDGGTDRR